MSSTRRFASLAAVLPVLLVTGDATFMGLGGWDRSQGGRVKGELDVDQLTLMGTLGRHWTDHLEFLFGLAYADLSADLKVTGEFGTLKAGRDADWIDPTVGLRYERGFAGNWRFSLRGDIGGFGVGISFCDGSLALPRSCAEPGDMT